MPVYLINHNSQKNTTPVSFLSHGLKTGAPGSPGSLGCGGIAHQKEIAYTGYKENIDAFILATMTREKVSVAPCALGELIAKAPSYLPLKCPRVTFPANETFSLTQCQQVAEKIGGGMFVEVVGRMRNFHIPDFTMDLMAKCQQVMGTSHLAIPRDDVSLNGAYAFYTLSGFLRGFLETNKYPAFSELTSEDYVQNGEYTLSVAGAKVRDFTEGDIDDEDVRRAVKHFRLDQYKAWKAAGDDEEGEKTYEEVDDSHDVELEGAVFIAKPSPEGVENNIGSSANLPQLPGLVFPYFRGMLLPDKGYLLSFVLKYVFRLLGPTMEDCKNNVCALRDGFKSFSQCDAGLQITMLCLGVDLALSTQSRLFAVIEGRVKGFALLGGGFAVFDGMKWNSPLGDTELATEARTHFDEHTSALGDLLKLLNECDMEDSSMKVDVDIATITSPHELMGQIGRRRIPKEKSGEMDKLIRKLRFNKNYLPLNVDNICMMLKGIYIDKSFPAQDSPCYLASTTIPFDDRRYRYLAMFGPEAPSLWNSKGVMHPFSSGGKRKVAEATGGEEEDEMLKRMPTEILIAMKPILISLADLGTMERNVAVSFDLKERASKNRCMCVSGPTDRKRIWETLWDSSDSMSKAEGNGKGKKKVSTGPGLAIADFSSFLENL